MLMSLQLEDTSVTAADYGNRAGGKIHTVGMKLIVCQEIALHHFYVLINFDLART